MTEELPAYLQPFRASFEGWTSDPDRLDNWANTVAVEAVTGYDPGAEQAANAGDQLDLDEYADAGGNRELVEIDTNYKATRQGQHPVRLTRTDAARVAAAILEATENTFHYMRCGRLRPAAAKELLEAIRDVEYQLSELRDHALTDLLVGTGLDRDPMAETAGNTVAEQHEHAAERATQTPADASQAAPREMPMPGWRESWLADATGFDGELAGALGELFPGSLTAFTESEAFGALAYRVNRRCRAAGETPLQVLTSLDPGDLAFASSANDPAAFLASRIDS